jgi:hypothetical protein
MNAEAFEKACVSRELRLMTVASSLKIRETVKTREKPPRFCEGQGRYTTGSNEVKQPWLLFIIHGINTRLFAEQ